MFAVVLTGPPGVGKSAALEALTDALHDDDLRHASIEVEAVAWAHPGLTKDQRLRHVEAVSRLYREEGFDLLLVAAPVASCAELNDLLAALGADDHFLVRFDASDATLRRRLVNREPPGWSQLDKLLKRSQEMRLAMASLVADLTIDTEHTTPIDAICQIRGACDRIAY